jgi:hypothetical protein
MNKADLNNKFDKISKAVSEHESQVVSYSKEISKVEC